jgi:photosystem II stability/assembly factor-like uncharacterized protein
MKHLIILKHPNIFKQTLLSYNLFFSKLKNTKGVVRAIFAALALILPGCDNGILEEILMDNPVQAEKKNPTDNGIKVIPSLMTAGKGVFQPFTAVDSEGNIASVTWTVSGANGANTVIGEDGVLMTDADETSNQLIVHAVSTGDKSKLGTAIINVPDNGCFPVERGIIVKPGIVTVSKGSSRTFTASFGVSGNAAHGLLWNIEGEKSAGTWIDADSGELTVSEDETAVSITVKASDSDYIYGTSVVFIEGQGGVPLDQGLHPESMGIELRPPVITLDKGDTHIFTAKGGEGPLVWTLQGTSTSVINNSVINIEKNESAEKIIVKADDGAGHYGTAIVTVRGNESSAELVNDGILVSSQIVSVNKGNAYNFTVLDSAGAGMPGGVKWRVTGAGKTGTGISRDGVLTIASGEIAAYISVRAENESTGRYGTAIVAVKPPEISGLTINPDEATVVKGGSRQFTAEVLGTPGVPQAVTWSMLTNGAAGTGIDSSTGMLTVDVKETAAVLRVKAVSAANPAISRTATVNVIGLDPSSWRMVDIPGLVTSGFYTGGIAYGNGVFVAAGDNSSIARSTDNGETWTEVKNQLDKKTIRTVAYGGGVFIVGGKSSMIAYSTDDGLTWTAVDGKFDSSIDVRRICYIGGKFFAMGTGGKMSYSGDGHTWTAANNINKLIPDIVEDIAYDGNNFILVGGTKMRVAYSSDAITWKAASRGNFNADTSGYILCVTYGNGKFVAGSNMTDGKIGYSVTGVENWLESSSGTTIFGKGIHVMRIAHYNDVFVAVGGSDSNANSGRMAYSYDGETWIQVVSGISGMGMDLAFGNGRFIAVSAGGKAVIIE